MSRKHIAERMCIVCRKKFPKTELTRYVRPDGASETDQEGPIHDPKQICSGRGFYLCGQTQCRERFPKVVSGLMKKR
ncbi:YlxR family protein [Pseudodesulfovibrio sediminis]|uniref:YlxR domain-containing protein n=1 Tax=Pseudodesulfovibrio sediminis TaxID=2810563 RepID=A0ABN6EPR8_9BACT|nr:DUF448 domain-containing protein [Pseudodesulfovibrio sediminis]BCS86803.1 hypothetical protein PSDVSF_00450 [Pseudodesulfovibrio sediminis]